ncbi:MAG TPA: heme lyase CcmF/NrfE family subunit [Longimicrobiales bacterium]|nr:heme lyase CcmF/NrfE family subunit [Longimicrobiales bacterium]
MIRTLAGAAIVAALISAVLGTLAAVAGARLRRTTLVRAAERAVFANFWLMTLANLAMVYALVTHDFSVSYVAQVGSRSTPLFFTIISLWSALEGSILFWGWVLSAYTAAAVWLHRGRLGTLVPYATATMLAVAAFFFILLVGPANPFALVSPAPLDGPGPNPLLQNHILMAIHPPFLYLGYVGMTVPFAFAIGALLSGRLDAEWIRATRRWTVVAWAFLSLAIMLGMWWSYEVLGWGGYWAWDPVENASFMPWLTATAFLHSVMVEERRGMLKVWNLSLIIATFLLTILGTFLTRSGIVSSVHAFSEGPIGMYFLVFIVLVTVFSVALLAGRSSLLGGEGRLDSPVSRETAFLVNNLLLTAFTFTVLLGTLFPLVAEAFRGVKVSVGAPFFNRMTLPLIMGLLFLVGVGPALPWRRTPPGHLRERFLLPLVVALAVLGLSLALGSRDPYALLAFTFGGFALSVNLGEFVFGTRARMRAQGEAAPLALVRLVRSNSRRYGGFTAHIGVLLLAIGVAASSAGRVERQATLRAGESMSIEGYEVRLRNISAWEEPQRFVVAAHVDVLRGGEAIGGLDPRLNFYGGSDQPITTPAVRSRPHEDLYLTLIAFERDGSSATVAAVVEPLVGWIWVGGVIVFLGALLSAVPFERKRVVVGAAAEPLDPEADALETAGAAR